ncbi:uncharacterized protein LOC120280533 [Dioscorea cayenensis subsp. rotundata]|uniref:Uncharacterized protein LOC120280533 n=1 Tax=Dioscorea cayennensis subsp. rotundata TaxID=55577 RepID=A0AB40CTA6_DIOCR|nr:uncharacterized protein LOC120280533 [Dioscorea cayenensis subsp. rotundata]
MKFKKGSKVEVLNTREAPLSSWWCAEIISSNGHNYVVKYDRKLPEMGASVEMVSMEVIRPCPPSAKSSRSWVPGDIVEVFDYGFWKPSVVSKVIEGDYFIVRLLGLHSRLRVHASDLRLRQSWQNNKWIVIGQDSRKYDEGKINRLAKEVRLSEQIAQPSEDYAGGQYIHFANVDVHDEHVQLPSKRGNKRARASLPSIDARNVPHRKRRSFKKEGRFQDNVEEHLPHLLEKVVAVASPQKVMGEIYMHASLNNRTTGFSQMDMARRKPSDDVEYDYITCVEPNDVGTMSSSVGSCSTSHSRYMPLHSMTCHVEASSSPSDEIDSCCGSGREESLPINEVLAAEVHKLELYAYRSTIEALYASGPLSWEQETLMTNLRLMLHISNDEHLMELRQLVSAEMS